MPILSISPAEMNAIEQLPEKDKDTMLPVIPIRGWVGSHRLINSVQRIHKAINDRPWVAHLDRSFPEQSNSRNPSTGEYTREVFGEVANLLKPDNGFENWYKYLKDLANTIPSLICLDNTAQLSQQITKLCSLERGISVLFSIDDIESNRYRSVLQLLKDSNVEDALVIFDYGKVGRDTLDVAPTISEFFKISQNILPTAIYSLSSASFPDDFAKCSNGENTIYERLLFKKVLDSSSDIRLIYSDRGGARADKLSGGGGVPSPRIDYPSKNEWYFIRKEFSDFKNPADGEKESLYTLIAKEIIAAEYWKPDLHVWGTQIIEYTSKGDMIGINSAIKATAVRLNIHMYNQLHYDEQIELINDDDDWED